MNAIKNALWHRCLHDKSGTEELQYFLKYEAFMDQDRNDISESLVYE